MKFNSIPTRLAFSNVRLILNHCIIKWLGYPYSKTWHRFLFSKLFKTFMPYQIYLRIKHIHLWVYKLKMMYLPIKSNTKTYQFMSYPFIRQVTVLLYKVLLGDWFCIRNISQSSMKTWGPCTRIKKKITFTWHMRFYLFHCLLWWDFLNEYIILSFKFLYVHSHSLWIDDPRSNNMDSTAT